MHKISSADLHAMDTKTRIRLHNSLLGPKPVHLVGTASRAGIPNLAVFNSACHVSSNPPLLGMMSRPLTVTRDTYDNIRQTGEWTLNAITADFLAQAHRAADKIASDASEFDHTGLTPHWQDGFQAPAVAQSPLQIGLRFREELSLPSSGTVFLVGEVQWIRVKPEGLSAEGSLAPEALGLLSSLGLDAYASATEVARFEYVSQSRG